MDPMHSNRPVRLFVPPPAILLAGASSIVGQDRRRATTEFQVATQTWSPLRPPPPFRYPNLQGVWVNKRATPFERPATLRGRPSLTDAEVAELQRRTDQIFWMEAVTSS